jgi:uncharacterized membrane protein YgcG
MRLFFTFDTNQREYLESEFESERLHEVNELIAEGRHETIQFAGVFMDVNGKAYVSGVPVVITVNTQLPAEVIQTGSSVLVTGHTNADGFVELETMALLPAGAVVPIGNPVEVEATESITDGNLNNSAGATSDSGGEAQESQIIQQSNTPSTSFKLDGVVISLSNNAIQINNQLIYLDANTVIEGQIKPGVQVEVEGYYDKNGRFIVTKIKVEDSKSGDGSDSSDSGSDDSNSGSGSDDSGSGGGDDSSGGSSGGGSDD